MTISAIEARAFLDAVVAEAKAVSAKKATVWKGVVVEVGSGANADKVRVARGDEPTDSQDLLRNFYPVVGEMPSAGSEVWAISWGQGGIVITGGTSGAVGVTSLNGGSGTLNLDGAGGISVARSGQTITVDGSSVGAGGGGGGAGFVSVKNPQYGAAGDGVTDDTAAIQACLDENLRVYIPAGSYVHSGLVVQHGQTIQGAGSGTYNTPTFTDAQRSRLLLKAGSDAHGLTVPATSRQVVISDIEIDGNRANQTTPGLSGLHLSTRPTNDGLGGEIFAFVHRVYTHDNTGDGFYHGYNRFGVRAYDTVSNYNSQNGFAILGADSGYYNCVAGVNDADGVFLEAWTTTILNAAIYFNRNGIRARECRRSNILSCGIDQNYEHGLWVESGTWGVLGLGIIGNFFAGNSRDLSNGYDNIYISDDTETVSITGNTFAPPPEGIPESTRSCIYFAVPGAGAAEVGNVYSTEANSSGAIVTSYTNDASRFYLSPAANIGSAGTIPTSLHFTTDGARKYLLTEPITIEGAPVTRGMGTLALRYLGAELCPHNNAFEQWNLASIDADADIAEAPNGTMTADKLTQTADGGGLWTTTTATNISERTYVFGVWLMADSAHTAVISLHTDAGTYNVNQNVPVTTYWQYFEVTAALGASAGNELYAVIGPAPSGSALSHVYAWGASVVESAAITSYPHTIPSGQIFEVRATAVAGDYLVGMSLS